MWLSWLEHGPINQKVVGLIPGQGTCLDCGFGPWSGHIRGNQIMFLTSMFLSLSPFPLKSISTSLGEGKKNLQIQVGPHQPALDFYLQRDKTQLPTTQMPPRSLMTTCTFLCLYVLLTPHLYHSITLPLQEAYLIPRPGRWPSQCSRSFQKSVYFLVFP